ncbi:ornithine carbamoyltransferase [Miniimonas sp. S16]|uniref:ornithine carbamoyltransferase n=1 Tax=Miniimonas sp. S16 TaxID=2171623 RepID=UPI000D52889C|nr:ornithine carbamoyltransferase [Miniimonas sp. S16]
MRERHLLSLHGWDRGALAEFFELVDQYRAGTGPRFNAAAAMFFPPSSLRTRFSFERGASLMGIQPVVFPPETLDKSEDLIDVAGYLGQWSDLMVVRHADIRVLERLAAAGALPIVNAMTAVNHPCEVLSDLYALSLEADPTQLRFLFVGADGNIARAWWEAAEVFELDIRQSCPAGLRVDGMPWVEELQDAISIADVVITDGPGSYVDELASYRVTAELMDSSPRGVRLIPCPPFVRGREVSADAISHGAFVGYEFKRYLMPVQQAVMARALTYR